MLIQNPEIFKKIEELAGHYRNHVCNFYLKPEFRMLNLTRDDWNQIENFTERTEAYRQQGFHLDELYTHLIALTQFIQAARSQLVPQVVQIIRNSGRNRSAQEQLVAQMAAENFSGNLGILAKNVYAVFLSVSKEDEANSKGGKPLYSTMAACKPLIALGS